MDLNLKINGDGTDAGQAFDTVASDAQDAAATIEQAFAGLAKKTEAAFNKMESETTASLKKMGDEGEAAWKRAEEAEKSNAAQLAKVQTALLAVGAAAVKFGIDSVHAFAEAQKVQLQLERAAGSLTEAFSDQADALEAQLHIDGELIKQQQTLLLQWGAAPEAIEPAIRAIEDYAAASGKDAVQATRDFLQAVENGDAKLEKFGVNFEQTGDKAKDFTALTKAMTSALGGAAAANAGSLQGGLDAVNIAFGNVKESFGGVIGAMESKLGVLEKVARAMQGIANTISGRDSIGGAIAALSPGDLIASAVSGVVAGNPTAPDITGGAVSSPAAIHLTGFDDNGPIGKPKGAGGSGAKSPAVLAHQEAADAHDNIYRHEEESAERTFTKLEKMRFDLAKSSEDAAQAEAKHAEDRAAAAAKRDQAEIDKANKDMLDRTAKKVHEAQAAGDAIGAAMVNALADQLSKLAEGGEFDAAAFISEILAAAVGIAGTVIGTAFGQPAVGAAIGNLAAMGIRAGGSAISKGAKSNAPRTMHTGGPVGDEIDIPRFHSGGRLATDEMHIIAQKGEHMLSRANVANMGGHAGVEAAKNGGGRPIYIQAIDSKSMADTLSDRGGDGFKQALRRGQGALPALFGRGPR